MNLELLSKAMANVGINADQATEAVKEFSSHIPPFTEDDILRIKMNSSLSTVAKIKIIKEMRKQMKGETE